MPNADQCQSMPIKIMALIEMPLNADYCGSIGIDRHWDQCQNFDWHWELIEGVLILLSHDQLLC